MTTSRDANNSQAAKLVRAPTPTQPAAPEPISRIIVNIFPGGFNWASFVAQAKGFFAKNGIEAVLQPTRNSAAQMTGLSEGKFDIAITAFDNIVAYVEAQGEAQIGPQPEFFAFMGSDNGFLSLVSRPEIRRFSDLKGKKLSVDARTTGYAFVLFDMLRRNGLAAGDYELVKVGGMAQRWEALRDGKQDATLLSTPFDIIADTQAFKRLGRVAEVIGPYQGNVAAAKRDWARAHQNEIIGFIRSYAAGIEWLYDKTNREDAVTILMANVPGLSRHLAQQAWEELLGRGAGFCRRAKVDEEGLRTVLKLRERYGEPRKSLNDPTKYYDPSYYDRAICV